jgi:hypothetical protein
MQDTCESSCSVQSRKNNQHVYIFLLLYTGYMLIKLKKVYIWKTEFVYKYLEKGDPSKALKAAKLPKNWIAEG